MKRISATEQEDIEHAMAEAQVPVLDFSSKSDPIATSRSAFSVTSNGFNSRYYDEGRQRRGGSGMPNYRGES